MSFPDPKPYDNLKAFINVSFFFLFLILGFRFASIPENTTQAATVKGETSAMFEPVYVVIEEETTEYFPHVREYFVENDFHKEVYITSLDSLLEFLGQYELVHFKDEVILSTSVKVAGYSKRFSQYSVSFSRDLTQHEKALIVSELLY